MAIYKKEPGESNPTQFSPGQQNIVPVTQAQYNALTTAEKNNGTVYHITDKNISFASADQIDYDNSTSGLEATKVQGALDEINSDLSELITKRLTPVVNYSLTAGGYNASIVCTVPSVTGYTPVGVIGYSTGGMYIFAMNVQLSSSGVVASVFNADTVNPRNGAFQANVLYVKTNSVKQ